MRSAPSPRWLKRLTRFATVVTLPKPASRAAWANVCPCATVWSARARRIVSTRSLLALLTSANAWSSPGVSGRNGSFCARAIPVSASLLPPVSHIAPFNSSCLRRDPLDCYERGVTRRVRWVAGA